jgi:hypothetical protein
MDRATLSKREVAALMQIRLGQPLDTEHNGALERLLALGLVHQTPHGWRTTEQGDLRCVEEAVRHGFLHRS